MSAPTDYVLSPATGPRWIRVWAFLLDGPGGHVIARRPYRHMCGATGHCMLWRELGAHRDAVTVVEVAS